MQATYSDILLPSENSRSITHNAVLLLGASLLIALCAQISINLPFGLVPITGQTFGVLIVAAMLGAHRGTLAVLLYLVEGACGLPFFAGGAAGIVHLAGPTGGYLAGFVAAAWAVGMLSEKGWSRNLVLALFSMALGTGIIFLFGLLWLANFVSFESLFALGLLPFIPGAGIKIALAAVVLPLAWKKIDRQEL